MWNNLEQSGWALERKNILLCLVTLHYLQQVNHFRHEIPLVSEKYTYFARSRQKIWMDPHKKMQYSDRERDNDLFSTKAYFIEYLQSQKFENEF